MEQALVREGMLGSMETRLRAGSGGWAVWALLLLSTYLVSLTIGAPEGRAPDPLLPVGDDLGFRSAPPRIVFPAAHDDGFEGDLEIE